jgi:HEAT repeat protein
LKGKKQALIYIASALAETDDPRAVSPLITALAELKDYGDNQNNPGSVREALTKLTGQKLSRLEEWQEWLKKNEARFPR